MIDVNYLLGKQFCLVFAKEIEETNKVEVRCHYGRAFVEEGRKLYLIEQESSAKIGIPSSAYNKILPSDGTDILKNSEYFVIVKLDKNIEF